MRIIIIHGWDASPQSDWYPWLKKNLEKEGHHVFIPRMPSTATPRINAWVKKLKQVVKTVDSHTYFIGHSIGCQTIMRYLAALPKTNIGGIIFVAPWFTLQNLEDEQAEKVALPWLKTPIDFAKITEKTSNITAFLSDNDPFVNLTENKNILEKNLKPKIIVKKRKGHFTADDGLTEIPEILEELRRWIK